ncbi:MAG TPA: FtsX-like permease family protein, partial [Bryobacteraceae bacterium]|nr:FtsX-like permease family protein [Bryobacteraceae bacterium]
ANEFALLNLQEASAFPSAHARWKIFAATLENPAAGKLRPLLIVLLGAVGFVLLIACANVVNLVLARNAARRKEISVRISLGATIGRLLSQLLAETALLTACGAALGLLLAGAGLAILRHLLPPNLAPLAAAHLDWPVLGFTAAVSVLAVVICGLAPAFRILHDDSHSALKAAGRGSDPAGRGIRDTLVIAETSLAIVLLLGAALFIRSFRNALAVDPGFQTTHQLSLEINQPATPPAELARLTPAQVAELGRKQAQQFDRILARVRALPGVTAAGAISTLPLSSEIRSASRFVVEGRPVPDAATRPVAETRSATLGYFAAMGIPLRAGRWFTQDDINGNNLLINEEMARRYWPGESAIGKRINLCSMYPTPCWLPVVGVVGNVHQYGLDAATGSSDIYFASGSASSVIIRSGQDPAALARAAIDAVHKEAPGIPVTQVMPLEDLLADSLAPRRFSSALLGSFAALALLLAAVGIYGVMNYIVGLRTREIGLRVALGARPARVWRLITLSAIRLAVIGMTLGLAGSLALSAALSRTLTSLTYEAHPWDPLSITASALLLAVVVVLACSIPAKRAMSVDPMTALREE